MYQQQAFLERMGKGSSLHGKTMINETIIGHWQECTNYNTVWCGSKLCKRNFSHNCAEKGRNIKRGKVSLLVNDNTSTLWLVVYTM
jgi:hypothetical protein